MLSNKLRLFVAQLSFRQILIAIGIFGISLSPFSIISIFLCVLILTTCWPVTATISTFFLRFTISSVISMCLQQLFAMALWLVGAAAPVFAVVVLHLIVYVILVSQKSTKVTNIAFINKADMVSIIVACISVAAISYGALSGGGLLQQLIRQFTTGYDATQHISLTISMHENQGYAYGKFDDVVDKIISPTLNFYPQGWSYVTSLWWSDIDTDLANNPTTVMLLFYCSTMLWYGMIVYLFCRFILHMTEIIGQKDDIIAISVAALMTLVAQLLVLVNIVYNNFSPFYAAMLYPIVQAFLISALLTKDRRNSISPEAFLVTSLIVAAGTGFSWLLTLPASYMMIIVPLILYHGNVRTFTEWLYRRKKIILLSALIISVTFCQVIIQLKYGDRSLINLDGGLGVFHVSVLGYCFLIAVLMSIYIKNHRFTEIFVSCVTGSLLSVGLVYFYQIVSSGETGYYATKLAFVSFLIILIFIAISLVYALNKWAVPRLGMFVSILFTCSALVFIPTSLGINLGSTTDEIGAINYIAGRRFLAPDAASKVSTLVEEKRVSKANFIMYRNYVYAEDINTTHYIQSLSRRPLERCNQMISKVLRESWGVNASDVINCAANKEFYIISSSKTHDKLVDSFSQHKNIKIILSN